MAKTVVHLITGLGKGGAETMLYQLIANREDPDIKYTVINMGGGSYYEPLLRDVGAEVVVLSFKKRPISSFFKLRKLIKNADTLCCWMYHANYIGYLVSKTTKVKKVVWNIRHSDVSKELNKASTLKLNYKCAKKSRKVDCVAFNGEKSKEAHISIGYCQDNAMVLNNGVNVNEYVKNSNAKAEICQELGIPLDKKIILSVARNHPIKDIPTFIQALGELKGKVENTVAVICGSGIDKDNTELVNLIQNQGLEVDKEVYLLGLRNDVPTLMAGADLYVLHSAGEAFPNVLVQAMACERVCITTDVGDARAIINDDQFVVMAKDVKALTDKMQYALSLSEQERAQIGSKNRNRVLSEYKIEEVVGRYESIYKGN